MERFTGSKWLALGGLAVSYGLVVWLPVSCGLSVSDLPQLSTDETCGEGGRATTDGCEAGHGGASGSDDHGGTSGTSGASTGGPPAGGAGAHGGGGSRGGESGTDPGGASGNGGKGGDGMGGSNGGMGGAGMGGAGMGGSNGGMGGAGMGGAGMGGSNGGMGGAGMGGSNGGMGGAGMGGAGMGGAGMGGRPSSLCDHTMPFGAPQRVPGLSAGMARARFSSDELTAYGAISTAGEWHIAVAERPSRDDAFGQARFPPSLYRAGRSDMSPSPARGGLVLYLESHFGGVGDWMTFVSTRGTLFGKFSEPSAVLPGFSGGPYALADDSAIYYHTDIDGTLAIVRSERREGTYSNGVVVARDEAGYWNRFPVVTEDELTLYFASEGYAADGDDWLDVLGRRAKLEAYAIRRTDADRLVEHGQVGCSNVDLAGWLSALHRKVVGSPRRRYLDGGARPISVRGVKSHFRSSPARTSASRPRSVPCRHDV